MVDELGMISRPVKEGEQDFVPIQTKTFLEVFLDRLHKKQQEYTKAYKPFDLPCARLDFEDKYNDTRRELERMSSIQENDARLNINLGDLEKYGNKERFELINTTEDMHQSVKDGVRYPVLMGYTENYKCKSRNHGISVSIPIDIWRQRHPEKKEEKPTST